MTTATQPAPPMPPQNRPGEARAHRWTYAEYQGLTDAGFRCRVELLGGRIVEMPAQYDRHAAGVELARRATERAFGPSFLVRSQLPLHLDRGSGPEPDAAVVPGGPRDYVGTGHPRTALLVIEVSDTTLRFDRRRKLHRYARAGYADVAAVLTPPAAIAPLAAPAAPVAIADLLP